MPKLQLPAVLLYEYLRGYLLLRLTIDQVSC